MKKKELKNSVGIWMDHVQAKLIIPAHNPPVRETIHSVAETNLRVKGESADGIQLGNHRATNNEKSKQNIEKNDLHAYFKKVAASLHPYNEILIFGPTTAQEEFYNYLLKDKSFSAKRITTGKSDYLTDNQLVEYVKLNL